MTLPPETQRAETLGPWRIWFDPPPIPVRSCDWHYQHEETDLDCPSWMNGSASSREACIAEIIDGYEDRAEQARTALSELQAREAVLEGALDSCSAALQRLHTDVEALMADSDGVAGLHHNGDIATWAELGPDGQFSDWIGDPLWAARNAWHDARTALSRTTPTQEA